MLRFLLPVLALAFSLAALAPERAEAGEVCNETSFVVEVARAWRGEDGLAVKGWTRIHPGACATTAPEIETGEQYLYARTTAAYLGGVREWRGGQEACVDTGDFEFEGVADCAALGLEARRFRRLSEAERERAVLMELDDFGSRAEQAGIQRLLQAAGYDIRLIDGYAGRRTRREIAAFERDREQSFGSDKTGLIEALHARALERNGEAGLHVCNESAHPVAAAVAQKRGERFESRGWWHIAPGACLRPVAERYEEGELYFYAEQFRSGSMAGTKLEQAKLAADRLLSQLGERDARTETPPHPVELLAAALEAGRIAATGYDYPVLVGGRYVMSPSPIPKFDNPKMDRSPALQLFGAGREKRIYAVPPYTPVTSLDFEDHPFTVDRQSQDCALCGAGDTWLDEVILDDRGRRMFVCSDTDHCAGRRAAGHTGPAGGDWAAE